MNLAHGTLLIRYLLHFLPFSELTELQSQYTGLVCLLLMLWSSLNFRPRSVLTSSLRPVRGVLHIEIVDVAGNRLVSRSQLLHFVVGSFRLRCRRNSCQTSFIACFSRLRNSSEHLVFPSWHGAPAFGVAFPAFLVSTRLPNEVPLVNRAADCGLLDW